MSRRVLIDGLNVIRCNPTLAKFETAHGTAAACRELTRLSGEFVAREGGGEYTLVFDGLDADGADREVAGPLLIVYAGERTADEIIVEMADDARALGHEAWIVSNDAELCEAGTRAMRSEEFYEALLRRPPARQSAAQGELAARLIAHLIAAGHLPRGAAANPGLREDLAAHLDYYALGDLPFQKLAKRLESVLRAHAAVTPDPDPEKLVYRALKDLLTKDRT